MPKYVALLRGIAPLNPNMRNDKLRHVFESLGFKNVQTVISSGNVTFESSLRDIPKLETMVEHELPVQLGFNSTTIIRTHQQLLGLAANHPFGNMEHSNNNYLTVTFLKETPESTFDFPYQPEGKTYRLLAAYGNAVFGIVDLTGDRTPDMMNWLEKQYGKEITTRTWKTVQRILKKLA